MSKSTKNSKTAKIPQPIKVKKEKLEEDRALHSMAHFIDDRVELVKQIFGSLKTKTILNLAPEYLKEKDMDEIQELCLNELLCLSTKRLLSIINATKCPSDTESSEDSDVETKDQHISLEEISSGSELENGDKLTKRTAALQSRAKRNAKKSNPADDQNTNNGQMSVLELLELQARARAIRSQLALEPVTKIEVDVDSDDDTPNGNVSSTTKEQQQQQNQNQQKRKKPTNKETEKTSSSTLSGTASATASTLQQIPDNAPSKTETETITSITSNNVSKQKIKLKRNFRKRNEEDSIEAKNGSQQQQQQQQQESQTKQIKIKKEKASDRSPSPDVIPIVPEPETFCISDSDTEADKTARKKETRPQRSTNRIEETEDGEIVDGEENSERDSNSIENDNAADNATKSIAVASSDSNLELIEDKRNKVIILEDKIIKNVNDCAAAATTTAAGAAGAVVVVVTADQSSVIPNNNDDRECKLDDNNKIVSSNDQSVHDHDHDLDGDQNDDIISLEGGDLETEMSEHLDDDSSSNRNFRSNDDDDDAKKLEENNDIISLELSDNEEDSMHSDTRESWHARYLKSSKVNKVLAVSRLGKRVRDKLKTSKLSKTEPIDDNHKEEEKKGFKSKHEDGSVEQYKEILEMSHRK